ncbi:hypothetical protein B0T14DRAFT_605806 [Immersiella caudata]|uniref:DUF676 domain-containing protein n=1 Tax=Immersiella caudata TaxID=314043 RepID=A0AA40BTM5_9PEZI|nr:hypothetical protein B0T14DRAFT_605806 [Immersiella caudata]
MATDGSPRPGGCPKIKPEGLTVLSGGPGSLIDVVIVHGLNGNPKATWTHPSSGFFWPWELRNHLNDARVMVFGYDAKITSQLGTNEIRIKGIAQILLGKLSDKRQEDEELDRPLIFIGHSLGGLVIESAICLAHQSLSTRMGQYHHIYNSTKGLILFGTPHLGSGVNKQWLAQILKKIAGVAFMAVPPKLESALESHSDELSDLMDSFRATTLLVNRHVEIYTFYESVRDRRFNSLIVDESSAKVVYDKEVRIAVQSTHQDMVKFKDEEDTDFENVCAKLKGLKRHALQVARGGPCVPNIRSYPPGLSTPANTFVPRESLFKEIRRQLCQRSEPLGVGAQVVGLWGLGGTGKSQIARGYLQCYRDEYDASFFIQAGDPTSVDNEFSAIYSTIPGGAARKPPSPEQARLDVLGWFQDQTQGRWLFIFDGADNLDKKDNGFYNPVIYFPGSSRAKVHIIITSRSSIAGDLSTTRGGVKVGPLALPEAVDLFFRRSGVPPTREESWSEVEGIVRTLGCLPLAVTIAAAYVAQTPRLAHNLPLYLVEYEKRQSQLLAQRCQDLVGQYDHSIMTVWETSLAAVNDQSPAACDVLAILGLFHNEHISPQLFFPPMASQDESATVHSLDVVAFQQQRQGGGGGGVHLIERCFAILEQYSLLQRDTEDKQCYSMHKLVHAWSNQCVSMRDDAKRFRDAGLFMLRNLGRSLHERKGRLGESTTPSDLNVIVHVREGLTSIVRLSMSEVHDTTMVGMLREIVDGTCRADCPRATAAMARVLLLKCQQSLGDGHVWTQETVVLLAAALTSYGKHEEALALLSAATSAAEGSVVGECCLGVQALYDTRVAILEARESSRKFLSLVDVARGVLSRLDSSLASQDAAIQDMQEELAQGVKQMNEMGRKLESKLGSDHRAHVLYKEWRQVAAELKKDLDELAIKRTCVRDAIRHAQNNEAARLQDISEAIQDGQGMNTLLDMVQRWSKEVAVPCKCIKDMGVEVDNMARLSSEFADDKWRRQFEVLVDSVPWYSPTGIANWIMR